ncbi:hypothetical protein LR48_Vigan01g328600 [Vigna angularis]|uniref:Uncharacterized protein n=1 Tax=Phaseolus angularis TaxID=3914 RepID=A0A0L9TT63_PHAAN|nr:hypothetical protein LR48_Vigan01g328600 [Vigna angularis]
MDPFRGENAMEGKLHALENRIEGKMNVVEGRMEHLEMAVEGLKAESAANRQDSIAMRKDIQELLRVMGVQKHRNSSSQLHGLRHLSLPPSVEENMRRRPPGMGRALRGTPNP